MGDNLTNPHVPEYMAKAPWYGGGGGGGQHQKDEGASSTAAGSEGKSWGFTVHYRRGEFAGQATKYRKGACRNCGAITHTEKDCVDRPRARGAWKTNSDIKPDEFIQQDMASDFDSKRDRYNGYDVEEHQRTIAKFALAEEERKRLRAEEKAREEERREEERREKERRREERRAAKRKAKEERGGEERAGEESDATASEIGSGTDTSTSDTDTDYVTSDSDDGVKERGNTAAVGQTQASAKAKTKMSVRNLRLREDRAKYLINLDVNSAHYDPKARSMRDNPAPDDPDALYTGDNAIRADEANADFMNTQVFAWEAGERGVEVNLQANPTQLELLKRQHAERKALLSQAQKQKVVEKYGTGDDLVDTSIPRELILGQGEGYVEYSRDGRIVKGAPPKSAKSKFVEDVHPGNHTSVWGSWYDVKRHAWGFACCHNTQYHAYCTGEAGKAAAAASDALASAPDADFVPQWSKPANKNASDKPHSTSKLYGEADFSQLDDTKLKAALARQEADDISSGSKRSHKQMGYHGIAGTEAEVTLEDLEAYRMKRMRTEDPMANFGKHGSDRVDGVDD